MEFRLGSGRKVKTINKCNAERQINSTSNSDCYHKFPNPRTQKNTHALKNVAMSAAVYHRSNLDSLELTNWFAKISETKAQRHIQKHSIHNFHFLIVNDVRTDFQWFS